MIKFFAASYFRGVGILVYSGVLLFLEGLCYEFVVYLSLLHEFLILRFFLTKPVVDFVVKTQPMVPFFLRSFCYYRFY